MLDLRVHVLTRVTGRVDCFGGMCVCVCPPDSKIKYSVFCVYSCSCIIILCYFTCIFYAVVRQISVLFIDNKDSVFCILYSVFCGFAAFTVVTVLFFSCMNTQKLLSLLKCLL